VGTFGISLFVLFKHIREVSEGAIEDHEMRVKIDASFGSPFKSMQTLFYAMLGSFDQEVNFVS